MQNTIDILPDLKLRLDIAHPTLEECYQFGFECAGAALAEEENPFKSDSKEHQFWQDGWWDQQLGEQPMFKAEQSLDRQSGLKAKLAQARNAFFQPEKEEAEENARPTPGA